MGNKFISWYYKMKYEKPNITYGDENLPPVTVNFAQPASQTNAIIKNFAQQVQEAIENRFGDKINISPKISESAKQI